MNWKKISVAMLGIGSLIAAMINASADRQLSSDVDGRAVEDHDEKTEEKLTSARETIKLADDVNEREAKEIREETKKWKKTNDYDGKLRDIHLNAVSELDEFKQSINYFERKQEIEDNAEDALDIFKESIDYDYEVEKLEDEIATAKSVYKKRSKLYDLAGSNDDEVSDTVGELKKAEKEKMDETIKKAQSKITELKGKVQAEKNRIDRKKQSEMRDLEGEIQAVKNRITKAENEASDLIRNEFKKADEQIRGAVYQKRTDLESRAIETYHDCIGILDEQKRLDAEHAVELYNNTPKYEMWANWLNANHVPKWLVIGVGLIPFVPAGYLVISYTKFLVNTVKAM